jgi:hypothetical protein
MSGKIQFTKELNWVTTNPAPFEPNTEWSGVTQGVMSGTNVIYSNIVDVTIKDNQGLEITYTGTPTGVIQIMASNSGVDFYALTFDPILQQPAGGAGGYLIDINQFPFKYLMVQYTNTSGSGILTTWLTSKDLN